MKIGIYNPYLNTLGGGEYYLLSVAAALAERHDVSIFWNDSTILTRIGAQFGLATNKIRVVPNFWTDSLVRKLSASADYDAILWVTDGSLPITLAQKLIVVVQYPFPGPVSFGQKIKLRRTKAVVCYSEFVKQHIDVRWGIHAKVISPGINIHEYTIGHKEPVILSVGRFTRGKNVKKHEEMITAFKHIKHRGIPLSLVLAGAVLPDDEAYVRELTNLTHGYPISLKTNISVTELRKLYASSLFYWHAAGYGENLDTHPEKAEHFGITTVEAMASGCIPCVFSGGGQREIVRNGIDGFTWTTIPELVTITASAYQNHTDWETMAKAARLRSEDYRIEKTVRQFTALLEG